jgi:hypothetical protein
MRRSIPVVLLAALSFAACTSTADPDKSDGERDGERGESRAEVERELTPLCTLQRVQSRLAAGEMPHDALVQAWRHRATMPAATGGNSVQWSWLGPFNAGGRIRAILIHPTNPSRIWIGSASGGVWRSDNAGSTWQPMNSFLSMLGIGSMALDPGDANHLYVGTGEGFAETVEGSSNTAFLRGAGIFESFDAGATWARIPSTATPDFYFTNRISVSPQSRDVLLAATGTGIFRSTDRAQTWTQVHNARTLDVDFHPTDGTRAVAGRTDGVALHSVDGGLTWSTFSFGTGQSRIEVAYARSNPTTVYACVTDDAADTLKVWRSLDGGATYAVQTTTATSTLGLYLSCLWVDPTNASNLIYGGQSIFRSTDGGVTGTAMTSGGHSDYHVIAADPGFNGSTDKRVYTGCDGGIYTRADWQAGSWSSLNVGLGITQLYGAAVNPATGVIVAGAQDNATVRYNGNPQTWTTNLIGGDGTFCCADQTDPNFFYAGYYWFGLMRSGSAGSTWTSIRGNLPNTSGADSNFVPYTLLDPNLQTRMIACGRALWRSDNVKTGVPPTWVQIKAPRSCTSLVGGPANAHYLNNLSCNIATAQIASGDSNLIWVGHNDGELHKTVNGTAATPTWQLVDPTGAGSAVPDRWISSIAIDPVDHQRVYLALLGYTPDNLWRTTDGGATWQPISGSGAGAMPSLPCTWIVQHPRIRSWLFVGTDIGLYWSLDDGQSWQPVTGGPETVAVEQLVWKNDRDLLVVTHGQGVWLATLQAAAVQPVGAGCSNGAVPALSATLPVVGGTQTFSMTGAAANALVFFGFSFGLPVPVAFGSCTLQFDLPNSNPYAAGFTSGTGAWSTALAIPASVIFVGSQITAQTFVFDAGGPMLGAGDLANGLLSTLGF